MLAGPLGTLPTHKVISLALQLAKANLNYPQPDLRPQAGTQSGADHELRIFDFVSQTNAVAQQQYNQAQGTCKMQPRNSITRAHSRLRRRSSRDLRFTPAKTG